MHNSNRYSGDPGIEIFNEAQIPHIVYRPLSQSPPQVSIKQQVELMRELQAQQTNYLFAKVCAWGLLGGGALVFLAIAAAIFRPFLQSEPAPQPNPIVIASPTPTGIQINPNCQVFCGTGK